MKKISFFLASAVMAVSSLGVSAQNAGVDISFDPALDSQLAEFPETFTMSFSFPDNAYVGIAKNIMVGNPVKVYMPGETTANQCTATFDLDACTVTVKTLAAVNRNLEGDYRVELQAGGVQFVDAEGVKTKCEKQDFIYHVGAVDGALKVTFDPSIDEEIEEFPASFTMTFSGDGVESLYKSPIAGNPVRILAPGADAATDWLACSGSVSGKTLTVTTHSGLNRTLSGEYKVQLIKDKVNLVNAEGTRTPCEEMNFVYNVKGSGPVGPQPVVYDVDITKYVPSLAPFDVANKTLETLQMQFRGEKMAPVDGAVVSISGPGYSQTAALQFVASGLGITLIKACFTKEPEYNGTYTLSIAEGVVGDATYMADHEFGHANPAINLEFEVVGGKDISEMKEDTSFSPVNVTPTPEVYVSDLSVIEMTFPSKVYFNADEELKVVRKLDQQALNFSSYGTAAVERVSDTQVKIVITPVPTVQAQYCLKVTKGYFWNEEHEADPNAGAICDDLDYKWMFAPADEKTVEVLSHTPATDATVCGFAKGEGISFNTDDNDLVASLRLSVVAYELDAETPDTETILSNVTSTTKDEEGRICWLNESDEPIQFDSKYFYEVTYALFDADGNTLAEGSFEFYGDSTLVSVSSVAAEMAEDVVFNLQGMRVNTPADRLPAGIYIISGKKVLVK